MYNAQMQTEYPQVISLGAMHTQYPYQTLQLGACRDPGLGGLGYVILLPVALGLGGLLWWGGRRMRKPLLSYAGAAVAVYPFGAYIWENCL
jgi:hypothetical protein